MCGLRDQEAPHALRRLPPRSTRTSLAGYRLADIKLALNAGWDVDLLAAELGELQDLGFDLGMVGFSLEEIDEMFAPAATEGEADPDATPEPPERPVATRGEPRKRTVTYLNLHFPSSPGMPCERPCR